MMNKTEVAVRCAMEDINDGRRLLLHGTQQDDPRAVLSADGCFWSAHARLCELLDEDPNDK